MKIDIDKIKKSQYQNRSNINGQPFVELKSSMAEVGLAVPIKVRPINKDAERWLHQVTEYGESDDAAREFYGSAEFEIVYGHRRVAAAQELGWVEIKAVAESLSDEQAMVQGLAENVQRDDIEPLDEAKAYKRLQDEFGWSLRRIADEVGRSPNRVGEMLFLLDEPVEVQRKVRKGKGGRGESDGITEYHIRAVRRSGLQDEDRTAVIKKAASEGLTASQTRKIAESVKAAPSKKVKDQLIEFEYDPFTHDPDRVAARAEKFGAHDPEVTKKKTNAEKKQEDWKSSPPVKATLDLVADLEKVQLPKVMQSIEAGKFAPEAARFTARKVQRVIDKLIDIRDVLEVSGEK